MRWLRAGAVLALSPYHRAHNAAVSTLERKTKAQMCAAVLLVAMRLPPAAICSMQELLLGKVRSACSGSLVVSIPSTGTANRGDLQCNKLP